MTFTGGDESVILHPLESGVFHCKRSDRRVKFNHLSTIMQLMEAVSLFNTCLEFIGFFTDNIVDGDIC